MDPVAITAQMTEPTFFDVVQKSPRKVREVLFSQLGVKAKKKGSGIHIQENREDRVRKLHQKLSSMHSKKESEVCRELIRNWLYTKRPMLKSALDFLGIPNDAGLVDQETDFFSNLSKDRVQELVTHLKKDFDAEHVSVYLQFMEVPHIS